MGDTPGAAFLPAQTLNYEVILVCSAGVSTGEGGVIDWGNGISLGANFQIQPPGHLIFLFIFFFWMLPTVTFFVCLFYMKEHIPFPPSQVYHFPLLLLNASYSNGMFSEFPPVTGLAASRLHIITAAESTRVPNPRSGAGTWDSFLGLEQTLIGALSQLLGAH